MRKAINAGGIIVSAGAAYGNLWKPSGLAGLIESKTSPTAVPADPEDVDDPGEADPPEPDELHDGLPEEEIAVDLPEPEAFEDDFEDDSHPAPPARRAAPDDVEAGVA